MPIPSFDEILSKESIYKDYNVLSPHYIPDFLPFREKQIKEIMETIAPALKDQKPKNLFIYGKTGTGKTCSIKHVMNKFNTYKANAVMVYLNCRISYNTKYKIVHKVVKHFVPEMEKLGFGFPLLYEKLMEFITKNKLQLIVVLDEIDAVKDLDGLIYSFTRANDELEKGGITLIGISNRTSFKNELDPRTRSSLYETEILFAPYTAPQLKEILEERVKAGFKEGVVDQSAINLIAAITARESGDARYALKLLLKSSEIALQEGKRKITDEEVEKARKKVELDLITETINKLPEHHQLGLLAISELTVAGGGSYARLQLENEDTFLFSGEVYEKYSILCKKLNQRPKSGRWFVETILKDLEMLGLIMTGRSGKGIRGNTTLIKLAFQEPKIIVNLLNKKLFS